LSIEITKECPLRCPGCYAFDEAHLGGERVLRDLTDFKGNELVRRVLAVVDAYKPLHVSLVGGDPLVRYRELEELLNRLDERRVYTQVVTSAFRPIPGAWTRLKTVGVVVSVDGLQPEHDARRKPATYERILANIREAQVTIHSTITAQIADRPGYLEEFVRFWSARPEVKKIWFSTFTPQRGAMSPEVLSGEQKARLVGELRRVRTVYRKLDMPEGLLDEFEKPPASPERCIFARTTTTISADLKTAITPCQFGGDPDCGQCGCYASMGLAAVGHHKVLGPVTAGHLFEVSERVGSGWRRLRRGFRARREGAPEASPFKILQS
jgi:MoaA/NifB/PqqE/SkfB family radical SAM enzyme